MAWYHFVAYFFAGIFITNGVPHFVMGTAGRKFPTPFATPPGKGESSALINVIWGFINFVAGLYLLQVGIFTYGLSLSTLLFATGTLLMSIMLSKHFETLYSN